MSGDAEAARRSTNTSVTCAAVCLSSLGDQPGARTPVRLASTLGEMHPGRYRIGLDVEGGSLGAWFERDPEPVALALYSAPVTTQAERRKLQERAVGWFERSHSCPWSHPEDLHVREIRLHQLADLDS